MPAKQLFSASSYNYVVITSPTPQTFPTLSDSTSIGYDTFNLSPRHGVSGSQDENVFGNSTNGTWPDCVALATSISTGTVLATIRYRNPA